MKSAVTSCRSQKEGRLAENLVLPWFSGLWLVRNFPLAKLRQILCPWFGCLSGPAPVAEEPDFEADAAAADTAACLRRARVGL